MRSEEGDRWVPSAGFDRDASAVITAVDDAIVEVLGWQPSQLVGHPSTDFIHPEDQGSAVAAWFNMLRSPGDTRVWRGRYQSATGEWIWVETVNVNLLADPVRGVVSSTMTVVNIEQVDVEEKLRAREQLISRLSDALPVGLFQIDVERRITFTNDRLHAITGIPQAATLDAQFVTTIAEDWVRLDDMISAVLSDRTVDDLDIRLQATSLASYPAGSASERVCMLALRPLTDGTGRVTGAIGCLSDITDRIQLQRELEVRASTDALTSCLNRGTTLELLDDTLGECPAGGGMAIAFVDLDHFKQVNDRLGHAAGDQILRIACARLRSAIRDGDCVGRLGGDEFLVICPHVDDPSTALELGRRLAGALTGQIAVGSETVELQASIGVTWTDQIVESDVLVARADAAMYRAKRSEHSTASLWRSPDVTRPAISQAPEGGQDISTL